MVVDKSVVQYFKPIVVFRIIGLFQFEVFKAKSGFYRFNRNKLYVIVSAPLLVFGCYGISNSLSLAEVLYASILWEDGSPFGTSEFKGNFLEKVVGVKICRKTDNC